MLIAEAAKASRALRARQFQFAAESVVIRRKFLVELMETKHRAVIDPRKDGPAVIHLTHWHRIDVLPNLGVILNGVTIAVDEVAKVAPDADLPLPRISVTIIVQAVDTITIGIPTIHVVCPLAATGDFIGGMILEGNTRHVEMRVVATRLWFLLDMIAILALLTE